jgi:hypothetical protein
MEMKILARNRASRNRLLILVSCTTIFLNAFDCHEPIPEKYRNFVLLGQAEQAKQIGSYAPDEQIEFYVFVLKHKHPPNLALAREIAKNGRQIIPLIIAKLNEETSERAQLDLIYILHWMAQDQDLSNETELIGAVESKIRGMQVIEWKAEAQSYLIEILKSRK